LALALLVVPAEHLLLALFYPLLVVAQVVGQALLALVEVALALGL
jgi:hypothetical protein